MGLLLTQTQEAAKTMSLFQHQMHIQHSLL